MGSYAAVTAPFAGTITRKLVDIGDLTVPGQPLFTIEEDASLRLVVAIPESRQSRIKVGDRLPVSIPSLDTVIYGETSELSASADPNSRSFEAKITLPAVAGLRAGQYGRLMIPSDSAAGLFVPSAAIVRRGQLELVYVVTDSGTAQMRLIRSGRRINGQIEVLSGLVEAERIVVEGLEGLAEGDRLKELP
jgi:RND family efflux transporter MFP subunit